MKKVIIGLILFSIIDVLYTTIGAFYGGGGAELNPLFAWLHDPIQFVVFVAILKAIVIGALVIGILWLHEYEKEHSVKCARAVGIGANVAYGCMMFGILGLNVWFQLKG